MTAGGKSSWTAIMLSVVFFCGLSRRAYSQVLVKTPFDTFQVLSDHVVKLEGEEVSLLSDILNLQTYDLSSTADANFAQAQTPSRIGRQNRVLKFGGDWAHIQSDVQRDVFLVFDRSLKDGNTYTLTVHGLLTDQTFRFTYNDDSEINGSVKTNQVGYLPESPKYGYVGNYLGSAGMMTIAPTRFELRDAQTHATVFSGTPRLRGDDLKLSGEQVYGCDFSAFTQPGHYYLYVPGIGRGYAFEIGQDVYNSVYYTSVRGLYYQRCGMALKPPYADARWAHDACHVLDGTIAPSQAQSGLYDGEAIGSHVPMVGGWHDAGDYGKYVPTAAVSIYYLLSSYELYPERFPDNVANIPESGNGVPDVLDEVKWEINWLKQMQAPDGGVYFKVTTTAWATTMPEADKAVRYISPKTTFTTGQFAAVMAMAYRSFAPYWPTYAQECLSQAEKAWDYLEAHPNPVPAGGFTNPSGIGGGEYNDPLGDADERAWAAAELYKTTGKSVYAQGFEKYWTQHPPMWGWNQFQHQQQKASWAYATTKFPTNASYIDAYKKAFKLSVDEMVQRTRANLYRDAYRSDVPDWIGWGSFAQSTQYAWELIRASYLLNDPSYLDAAKINLDAQLGNNPQSMSYITGVGSHYPMDPLQRPSMHDGVDEPVPGIPVFGPHNYLASGNPYFEIVKQAFFPAGSQVADPYPLLRRYVDSNKLVPMSEFTIQEMALDTGVYGFFSSFTGGPSVSSGGGSVIGSTGGSAGGSGGSTGGSNGSAGGSTGGSGGSVGDNSNGSTDGGSSGSPVGGSSDGSSGGGGSSIGGGSTDGGSSSGSVGGSSGGSIGGGGGATPPPVDTTSPRIDAFIVDGGTQEAEPDTINREGITIRFSEPVDTSRIEVQMLAATGPLKWHLNWMGGDSLFVLMPDTGETLGYGEAYQVVLSRVVDKAGNGFASLTMPFTTRSAPLVPAQPILIDFDPTAGNQHLGGASDIGIADLIHLQLFSENFSAIVGKRLGIAFDPQHLIYVDGHATSEDNQPHLADQGNRVEISITASDTAGDSSGFVGEFSFRPLNTLVDSTSLVVTLVDSSAENPEQKVFQVPVHFQATGDLMGDFNRDGQVDINDFLLLMGSSAHPDALFDLNGDGRVDDADLRVFMQVLGNGKKGDMAGADTASVSTGGNDLPSPVRMDVQPDSGNQNITLKDGIRTGDVVTVQLFAAGVSDVSGLGVQLAFDPKALRYVPGSFEAGDFIQGAKTAIVSGDSVVNVGVGSLKQTVGSENGLVGALRFEVTDVFRESTQLMMTTVDLLQSGVLKTQPVHEGVRLESFRAADFNRDGIVGIQDFVLFAQFYGKKDPWFDLDRNGIIDYQDFLLFVQSMDQ